MTLCSHAVSEASFSRCRPAFGRGPGLGRGRVGQRVQGGVAEADEVVAGCFSLIVGCVVVDVSSRRTSPAPLSSVPSKESKKEACVWFWEVMSFPCGQFSLDGGAVGELAVLVELTVQRVLSSQVRWTGDVEDGGAVNVAVTSWLNIAIGDLAAAVFCWSYPAGAGSVSSEPFLWRRQR